MKIKTTLMISVFFMPLVALLAQPYTALVENVSFRVREERLTNGKVDLTRDEVFIAAAANTSTDTLCLVSINNAFLNLTNFRIVGTNVWFSKWEFGRKPIDTDKPPLYMLASGSIGFQSPQEYHLVLGDGVGITEWNKHFENTKNGTTIETRLIITAKDD
jgi:hypothetical protein